MLASYNQACLMWQVCLLVKYNIKAKSVCVCVCRWKKLILIYLWCTCWHHEYETTGSAFSLMTTMIRSLGDFKPILDLDLYGEHMPEERITRLKIYRDLSAGSTYTRVYTVFIIVIIYLGTVITPTLIDSTCSLTFHS